MGKINNMDKVKALAELLLELDNYVITGHAVPDGDSIGSVLGMYGALRQLGKKVQVLMSDSLPELYGYLPYVECIRSSAIVNQPYNMIFLDCANQDRAGQEAKVLLEDSRITINIDHHGDNSGFGDINLVDARAAATAEIMCRILKCPGYEINHDIADCLYAGIIMDSGRFINSNTTSRTMIEAAWLLDHGADVDKARNKLFESKSRKEVELLREGLNNIQFNENGKIAWMVLSYDLIDKLSCHDFHPEGLINYTRSIAGVEVGLLFRETRPGLVKIGFRSRADVDVAAIAHEFGGGGHRRAAGATHEGDLSRTIYLVVRKVEEVIK